MCVNMHVSVCIRMCLCVWCMFMYLRVYECECDVCELAECMRMKCMQVCEHVQVTVSVVCVMCVRDVCKCVSM